MNKKIILLPALMLSLAFSQGAFSHEDEMMKLKEHHVCMHHAVSQLNLTQDQKTKIKTIKEQAKQEMKKAKSELHAIRMKMRPLVDTDTLDVAKLDALIQQKKDIIGAVMKTKLMAKHQMYTILDAKQKVMFNEMATKCDVTE